MKAKNLLKKAFLLLALVGGANSAWANYSSSTVGTTTTLTWDFQEFTASEDQIINPNNYDYHSIIFKGGTDNETLTKNGFRINGNTGSGTRNASYTPAYNGTITVYAKANGTSNARYALIATTQSAITADPVVGTNNCIAVSKNLNSEDADKDHFSVSLTSGTTYYIEARQGITISKIVYEYTLPAPTTPTVNTDGSVSGGTQITISSTNASTIYYYWSDSNTAPEIGDASYSSASGASVAVNAPNVTGTRYLHTYGNNASGTTSVATFTYSITAAQLPAGLAYAVDAVSKNVGDDNFTNTLTNPHSLTVTYSITSNGTGSTINASTGQVTIGSTAGTETITASSEATSEYLAGEATYTLTVNSLKTVTYAISVSDAASVTGSVPASVEVISSVTLPVNQTLYKEGNTLTGWNDGKSTYVPGASATISGNTTMTAVFTPNTAGLGVCPATVTWQFQTGQGAPTWSHEGDDAFVYVSQMGLGNDNIDMPLILDPSKGKIANGSWTDWCQMNGGTKLTAPVIKGSVLKLYVYQEGETAVTFNEADGSYSSNIYTYTATAADETKGNVEIVIGDQSYIRYLTVTYPIKGVKIYDYETSVGTGVVGEGDKVSSTTQSINGSSVNVIKMESNLNSSNKTYYWKITPAAGTFKSGDRIIWTGCYSNSSTKTTTIAIFDDDDISSAIVTGESFANVYGGTAGNPKPLTTGYFTLTADAEALYIGRYGATNTYLTSLTVVRENETATIGDKGYTTFSSSYPLNLSNMTVSEGTVTAYSVLSAGVTSSEVTPTVATGNVAAGEGLILGGTAGATVTIPVVASGDAISGNLMKGCPTGATLNSSTPNYETCYVLINGTTEAEFANLTNWISGGQEVNIPAGKAYLNTTASNSARSLRISFGNITNVTNVEAAAEAKAQDGKFIENGKLVIVKNGKKFNANGQQVK